MAEKLELVYGYDFMPDAGTVSLLNYTDGLNVAYQGYVPRGEVEKDGYVYEALTVRVRGTSMNDLASKLQGLAERIEYVRNFEAWPETRGVWLRVQLEGESNARQAFVVGLEGQFASSVYDAAVRNKFHVNDYRLGVKRMGWWEGTAATSISGSSVSIYGGTVNYAGIDGDMAARVARVNVQPLVTGTATGGTAELFPTGEVWLGFRGDHFGTPTEWVSQSSLYVAGVIGGAASTRGVAAINGTADAYAVGVSGSVVYWNTATHGGTTTMYVTTYRKINEISPTWTHMLGKFRVLLRAKLFDPAGTNTDGEFNVQMVTAYENDHSSLPTSVEFPSGQYYPKVRVAGGMAYHYHLYDLGEVTFPPEGRRLAGVSHRDLSIFILGELLTRGDGTPHMRLDSLVLIPTAEGAYWGGRRSGASYNYASVEFWGYNGPDEHLMVQMAGTVSTLPLVYGGGQPFYEHGLPIGDGVIVVAANDLDVGYEQHPSWKVDIAVDVKERWKDMRGSE